MLSHSADTPSNGVQKQYPIIELEYTKRGVLRKKLYSKKELSVQFVRIAAITFPKPLEIYNEKQLPKKTSKTIKNLRYNTSPLIDEEATYRSLRNKYLLHNQSTIDTKAIRNKYISSYLSQLIKNNIDIHIINSPKDNVFLVVGVEYSTKVLIHPESIVRSKIVNGLSDQHYLLDQYPNLLGMASLAKINLNFQISFYRSTTDHPQMQKFDRAIIYKLIDRITKTSKLNDAENYNYDINGFTSAVLEDPLSASRQCFQLYLDNGDVLNYAQLLGTSLVVHADHDKFQSWLLNYSFYLEHIKSPQLQEVESSIIVIGGPRPLGYTEIDPSTLRLDFLEIIKNNPFYVWMPVFRLIGALYTYSARQNIAAEFNQYWSDIRQALGELMSQVDSFDKLIEKLVDSFENEINLTDDLVARSLLSVFNQMKLISTFDRNDTDFSLPKRSYISSDNYSFTDIFLLLYTLTLRASIDWSPIHSLIINDYDLSALMTMDKVRIILDDKNTGFDDVSKVHRATRMRQSRFNNMPKIILSYNQEVRKFLTKNRFSKYEDGKKRIPLFEKSCLLLPDQPLQRIFVSNSDESLINSVIRYENRSIDTPIPNINEDPIIETSVHGTDSEYSSETDSGETPVEDSMETESSSTETESNLDEDSTEEEPIEDSAEESGSESDHQSKDIDSEVEPKKEDIVSTAPIETKLTTTTLIDQDSDQEVGTQSEDRSIPVIPVPVIKSSDHNQIAPNKEQSRKAEKNSIRSEHNIDEAIKQYNEIFDIQKIYDQLLQNQPILTQDMIFGQIDILVSNLSNLYQFYLSKSVILSKEEVKAKDLDQLRDNELISIHPTADKFMIELTKIGKDEVNKSLRQLNKLVSSLKNRRYDIQNIMINSSSIMEQFRQQGKIKFEVALLNWPKLLSLAYYDKFSKLAPIAHGIDLKITKFLDDGSWITNHDEFIKAFVKRYQTSLYAVEQEILTHKDQVLEDADMKTLPKIKIIRPANLDTREDDSEIVSEPDDLLISNKVDTTLKEYDQFEHNEPEPENYTDKEIINIVTFEKEDKKKPVVKPKKTKAARERAARELLKAQKEVFEEHSGNTEYESDFVDLDSNDLCKVIQQRMADRIENISGDVTNTLYFFQPSWNVSIDNTKQQFDLEELPISLFNFKTRTKKMLSGVMDNPTVKEFLKSKIDWSKLPSIGKKTHEEITDFQLLFENWSRLKGEEIFRLMSRDGLTHLFEQEIYFEPKKLPDNILLPLHDDLKLRFNKNIESIIRNNLDKKEDVDISRKIISSICTDLCTGMGIEIEDSQAEVIIHKINQFQHKNYKMSNMEKDPYFDLTWILKFDNYHDSPDKSMSLDELKTKITEDLDHLMLTYQVQKDLMDLHNAHEIKKPQNKKRRRQTA